jgi:hypothetical protein
MTSSPDLITDREAFAAQVRRHARELHVHGCAASSPGPTGGPPSSPTRRSAMDVLRIEDGLVREIVTFDAAHGTAGPRPRAGVPPRAQRVKLKSAVRATPSPRSSRSVLHEPA